MRISLSAIEPRLTEMHGQFPSRGEVARMQAASVLCQRRRMATRPVSPAAQHVPSAAQLTVLNYGLIARRLREPRTYSRGCRVSARKALGRRHARRCAPEFLALKGPHLNAAVHATSAVNRP